MSAYNFKGVSLKKIYRGPNEWHLNHFPAIENRRSHAVLFELPLEKDSKTPPKPHEGEMKWDSSHVKLPCASQNDYKTESGSDPNTTVTGSRWEIIEKALLRDISSSRELELAILTYNTKYSKEWKFKSLHRLFEQELDDDEAESFFRKTLPGIIGLALQLPQLIKCSIPLLKRGQNRSISLSQLQIACLLANAFLCTFPRRNEKSRHSEYFTYPSINFSTLFQKPGDQNIEKIKCICNYFRRVCSKNPVGVVTFTRRSVPERDLPEWDNCQKTFADSMLYVSDDGTIEDDGSGLLQVDFANKFLGGGVLNYGCVQEEIRFMICPELLCSRLFTEVLDDNECLLIMGCERFSKYTGYASTFTWTGDYLDLTPFDSFNRRKCSIVAIDAILFKHKAAQYSDEMLLRELNKAYVGFKPILPGPAVGVATGNWGCGAFNGDKHLKSLIQLMACHINDRPLAYFTFDDEELCDDIFTIYEYLKENKVKISELWTYLCEYAGEYRSRRIHLYDYIIEQHREPNKSSTNGHCSKQANRFAVITSIKPKPISKPTSKHSPKSELKQPDSDDEFLAKALADSESKQYHIEDSDVDDQYQEDEIMEHLGKPKDRAQSTRDDSIEAQTKSPNEKRSHVNSSSDYSTAQTIANFFPKSPSNTTEQTDNQDKRPRSSLVQCLDKEYNKSPLKVKQSTIMPKKTVITIPNTSTDVKAEAKSDAKFEDEMEVDEETLIEDSEYETANDETYFNKDESKDDFDQRENSTMSIDLMERGEEQMDVSNHEIATEPNVERKEMENKTPMKDNVQKNAIDYLNESSILEPVKSTSDNSSEDSNVCEENDAENKVKDDDQQEPTVDDSIMTDDESDTDEVMKGTNHRKSLNFTPDKKST